MAQYRVDLTSLLDAHGASVDIDDTFQMDALTVGDETFVPTGPAHVRVTVSNTGQEFVAYGTVSLPVTASCVRCLCDFPLTIEGEVSGFYIEPGRESTVPEKQEYEYVSQDKRIDLAPALLQALVLEAPFAPVHAEECAGLCATCGADLNTEHCDCARESDDSGPFSALKDLVVGQEQHEE